MNPIQFVHASRLGAAVASALLMAACGSSTSDTADGGTPETRIELIYVDDADSLEGASSGAATAEAAPGAVRPPAPTPADEVGGDDLISYDPDGTYTVQVATYSDAARARRRAAELVELGYPAYAVAHPEGRQVRVRIGYFASHDRAERFGKRFTRDHGGKFWVDRRAGKGRAGR